MTPHTTTNQTPESKPRQAAGDRGLSRGKQKICAFSIFGRFARLNMLNSSGLTDCRTAQRDSTIVLDFIVVSSMRK
jgi:hypothetical protein